MATAAPTSFLTAAARRIPPIQCLLTFEALARLRSVTQTADELCVTPSAVSHRVKQLEQILGVRLFGRADLFSLCCCTGGWQDRNIPSLWLEILAGCIPEHLWGYFCQLPQVCFRESGVPCIEFTHRIVPCLAVHGLQIRQLGCEGHAARLFDFAP